MDIIVRGGYMIQVLKHLWQEIVEWFFGPVPQYQISFYNGRSILEV